MTERLSADIAFGDAAVEAAFRSVSPLLQPALLHLRALILAVGARTPGVGGLVETLKWGEPAYLPRQPGIGTTIRINALKGSSERYALYVNCQTTLIEAFERNYPGLFALEGNRAVLFRLDEPLPQPALEHCIALALTYHRWSKGRAR